jgi:ketosteroid isomerase-like protein
MCWSGCGTAWQHPRAHSATDQTRITNLPPASVLSSAPKGQPENRAPAPPAAAKLDLEMERQTLLETDNRFSRASEERGTAQAFYEFLAPDAVSLPMNALPIQGRDAIRVQLAASPQSVLVWKPVAAEVSSTADLGYTWGNFEQRSQAPNARPQTVFGKYITVWRKQADGSWKAVLDAGNLSPSPQQRR